MSQQLQDVLLSQTHNVLSRTYAGHWRAACSCGWKADGNKADVLSAKASHLYAMPAQPQRRNKD